ncbi:hypothetical protein [Clostridium magnum]|uniref:Uncharacterized protein n=1 Tax=Clostridium magnum DSM 2767 TaxID=1121326 RepID=A0A162QLP3_9CLOT|nr:hypothetical protein [Clostridium magnum]KZL88683.1 hypothetical protein CLMAG_59720 [Clostridium magnum DSM 2767]SHJ60948.1 hypothetical protein SAMN02745944_06233 [Clostridium magnum DSM 2767]
MDIKEFANLLSGRQYGKEITKEEEQLAKEFGFVVVFGYSDDVVIFEGAISDEAGCYEGREIYIDSNGIFEGCECECKYSILAKEKAKAIEAIWGKEYSWEYKTSIPHETFEIFEDGEKYCRGIVFDIKDLT